MARKIKIKSNLDYVLNIEDKGQRIKIAQEDLEKYYGANIADALFREEYNSRIRRKNYDVLILDEEDLEMLHKKEEINLGDGTIIIFQSNLEEKIKE